MVDFFENTEENSSAALPFEENQLYSKPFSIEDLPTAVRQHFAGKDGGSHVLIYPSIRLFNGKGIQNLSEEVRGLELALGQHSALYSQSQPLALYKKAIGRWLICEQKIPTLISYRLFQKYISVDFLFLIEKLTLNRNGFKLFFGYWNK